MKCLFVKADKVRTHYLGVLEVDCSNGIGQGTIRMGIGINCFLGADVESIEYESTLRSDFDPIRITNGCSMVGHAGCVDYQKFRKW